MCIEKQNTYCTAYDRFIILLNNNSATSQHFHDDQIAIVELLENLQLCSCIVPFKSKLTVRCESRFSIISIPARIKNRDSRTSYGESSRRSSLAGQKTKDSPITDFLKILQRQLQLYSQQHGYTYSDSHKATVARNKTDSSYKGNVSSRTSVSCFISSSKVSNACSIIMQTNSVYSCTSNSIFIL